MTSQLTPSPVEAHSHLVLLVGDVGPLAVVPRLVGLGNVRRGLDAHPPAVGGGRPGRPGGARGVVRDHGLDGLGPDAVVVVVVVVGIVIVVVVVTNVMVIVMVRAPQSYVVLLRPLPIVLPKLTL